MPRLAMKVSVVGLDGAGRDRLRPCQTTSTSGTQAAMNVGPPEVGFVPMTGPSATRSRLPPMTLRPWTADGGPDDVLASCEYRCIAHDRRGHGRSSEEP